MQDDIIIDLDKLNMTIDFNNINMDIDFSFLDRGVINKWDTINILIKKQ